MYLQHPELVTVPVRVVRWPAHDLRPVGRQPLDVVRILVRMGEGVVQLRVLEAAAMVGCGERPEGGVAPGELEQRLSHPPSLTRRSATALRPPRRCRSPRDRLRARAVADRVDTGLGARKLSPCLPTGERAHPLPFVARGSRIAVPARVWARPRPRRTPARQSAGRTRSTGGGKPMRHTVSTAVVATTAMAATLVGGGVVASTRSSDEVALTPHRGAPSRTIEGR